MFTMWRTKVFTVIALFLLLEGCGWQTSCVGFSGKKTAPPGRTKVVVVGGEMVQETYAATQCLKTLYEPTGLNKTLFNREPVTVDHPLVITETVEKELLYAGRENNTLHITYREYTLHGMARTPFYQNLYYDLNSSDKIVFQNWLIHVLEANNQQIVFKVIKE